MPLLDSDDFYPTCAEFTPPNSTFDKRDSTKSPCFYAESGIKWFQQNAPQRLTDAGESVTMKIQKGILPIDGQFRKLVTKTVTAFLDQRAVTFLCDLCKQSGLIRWSQESSEQPSAVHSHSSSIPPFPVLPVVRGAVPSAFASENWPPIPLWQYPIWIYYQKMSDATRWFSGFFIFPLAIPPKQR